MNRTLSTTILTALLVFLIGPFLIIVAASLSAGDTLEEAIANAGEALAGHFAAMRADNEAIPSPRSFEDLRHDPEFMDDSEGAIVTMVTAREVVAAAE